MSKKKDPCQEGGAMTKDRAANILELQLASAAIDGRRMDWRKKNYMEALKVAIEALVEKIEEEEDTISREENT